jgi:hypothetical protein
MGGALGRVDVVVDAPMAKCARMRAWSRHRPHGATLRAVTIVNCSTVRCVQSYQGNAMPLVNAASSRRMILRMMRRDKHRGSQLSRRADEPTQSSGISLRCLRLRSMPCPVGAGRMRAPLAVAANGGSAMRH